MGSAMGITIAIAIDAYLSRVNSNSSKYANLLSTEDWVLGEDYDSDEDLELGEFRSNGSSSNKP